MIGAVERNTDHTITNSEIEIETKDSHIDDALDAIKVAHGVGKAAKTFSWSQVNFSVGEKKILTDCWGQVK